MGFDRTHTFFLWQFALSPLVSIKWISNSSFHWYYLLFGLFSVFRRERTKRKRNVFLFPVRLLDPVKGCQAMHFTLDERGVFVYALRAKDKTSCHSFSSAANFTILSSKIPKNACASSWAKASFGVPRIMTSRSMFFIASPFCGGCPLNKRRWINLFPH